MCIRDRATITHDHDLDEKYEPRSLTISEKNLILNPGHNLKGTQSHKKYIIGGLQLEKLKFQCLKSCKPYFFKLKSLQKHDRKRIVYFAITHQNVSHDHSRS